MRASERSRRYRQDDGHRRTMPAYLFFELHGWTLLLGVFALICAVYAIDNGDPTAGWIAGCCGLGAALTWMMARSG
ncbi:MAG: hypothetical protein ACYST0_04925 [Planctomycetota bacterium]